MSRRQLFVQKWSHAWPLEVTGRVYVAHVAAMAQHTYAAAASNSESISESISV
jgi:hypothetical protein